MGKAHSTATPLVLYARLNSFKYNGKQKSPQHSGNRDFLVDFSYGIYDVAFLKLGFAVVTETVALLRLFWGE